MTRVHDMGGRYGDGKINPDLGKEDVFKAKWHARALAVTLASGSLKKWNLDMSRHARECLPPKEYATFSYYEKWISALANLLVEKGVINSDKFLAPSVNDHPLSNRKLKAADVSEVLGKGAPTSRKIERAPRFIVGQNVKTKRAENSFISGGHTRLPRYAEKSEGIIEICHGAHVFPDTHAHNLGEQPEYLYTVSFLSSELWQNPENPGDTVCVDIWESYLEPFDD